MLGPVASLVRRHDPDRFLTTLFAPAARRETLCVLYALNHELARAREVASDPALALIRLQWWREVVEGAQRRHPVAEPLSAALAEGRLQAGDLLDMIAARETEAAAEIATLAEWLACLRGGAGSLAVAAGRALGADDAMLRTLRDIGAAYGVAGVLRNEAVLARQGRSLLPADLLAKVGLSVEAAIAQPNAPGLASVRSQLAKAGRDFLPRGRTVFFPRETIAAALPGVFARRDLRRSNPLSGPRRLGDKVAIVLAAWRGRV